MSFQSVTSCWFWQLVTDSGAAAISVDMLAVLREVFPPMAPESQPTVGTEIMDPESLSVNHKYTRWLRIVIITYIINYGVRYNYEISIFTILQL